MGNMYDNTMEFYDVVKYAFRTSRLASNQIYVERRLKIKTLHYIEFAYIKKRTQVFAGILFSIELNSKSLFSCWKYRSRLKC